jgi:hypothetical protein
VLKIGPSYRYFRVLTIIRHTGVKVVSRLGDPGNTRRRKGTNPYEATSLIHSKTYFK